MMALWVWALGSGLAVAVVSRGALPGVVVLALGAALVFAALNRPRPVKASPPPASPAAERAPPLAERPPRPSAEMQRAALGADDLTRIRGLGPKLAEALRGEGVTRFAQIAAWTPDQAAAMDEKLGARGRALRDDWAAQARALTLGTDRTGDDPERA